MNKLVLLGMVAFTLCETSVLCTDVIQDRKPAFIVTLPRCLQHGNEPSLSEYIKMLGCMNSDEVKADLTFFEESRDRRYNSLGIAASIELDRRS